MNFGSRCFAEPIFCEEGVVSSICANLHVEIEYFCSVKKARYSVAYFSITSESGPDALRNLQTQLGDMNKRTVFRTIDDNKVSFPSKFYQIHANNGFRIREAEPKEIKGRMVYEFVEQETKRMIFKNFDLFVNRVDWTHFFCLPFAPNFPDFVTATENLLRKWGLQINTQTYRTHITFGLFVVQNDQELEEITRICADAVASTNWLPDRKLSTPAISVFGEPERARILYLEPAGEFLQSVRECIHIFVEKMHDAGYCYIEDDETTPHVTLLRPNHVIRNAREFDATPLISSISPTDLPVIDVKELRLVQRFAYDADKFYHTVARFNLPKP